MSFNRTVVRLTFILTPSPALLAKSGVVNGRQLPAAKIRCSASGASRIHAARGFRGNQPLTQIKERRVMVNRKERGFTELATTLIGVFGVIILAGGLVFGQNFSAAISGFVRDTTGALVPGTTVTAKHTETGLTRTAQTSEEGSYTMPSLPVGSYEVTAEKPGFKQQVRRGITLVVAQEAVVNLTLDVGDLVEKITVTEEVPIVNTTLSSVSGLINEQQIKEMPLNGRSFNDLLVLNTNVNDNRSNTAAGGPSFSIAGKRLETNRWTINGMDYVGTNSQGTANAPNGMSDQLLGVDAVREYNVLGHSYGAEYGKRSGGQITVVTTSGTNQWHGALFEYLRNNKLDARNFFSTTEGAPPFKRNQFGGSLGRSEEHTSELQSHHDL